MVQTVSDFADRLCPETRVSKTPEWPYPLLLPEAHAVLLPKASSSHLPSLHVTLVTSVYLFGDGTRSAAQEGRYECVNWEWLLDHLLFHSVTGNKCGQTVINVV